MNTTTPRRRSDRLWMLLVASVVLASFSMGPSINCGPPSYSYQATLPHRLVAFSSTTAAMQFRVRVVLGDMGLDHAQNVSLESDLTLDGTFQRDPNAGAPVSPRLHLSVQPADGSLSGQQSDVTPGEPVTLTFTTPSSFQCQSNAACEADFVVTVSRVDGGTAGIVVADFSASGSAFTSGDDPGGPVTFVVE